MTRFPASGPLARACGAAIEALLPNRCVACERPLPASTVRATRPFCARCEAALPWWRAADGCPRCGDPIDADVTKACPRCLASGSPLHRCETVLRYEGPVVRWVPGWKRFGRPFGPPLAPARAVDDFARRLGGLVAARALPVDVLVPVPIHTGRLWRRGFDQAHWIARRMARADGPPLVSGWLRRVRATPPQASLAAPARRDNVRGAFAVATRLPRDVRIGLIDDVLTTGSTLDAAADVLLEAGALEVRALTLAATRAPAARRPRAPRTPGPRGRGPGTAGRRQSDAGA